MTKIGIIICDRYHTCAGGKCLRALRNREGAFARYKDEEVELVGYTTCDGCPGGNVEYAPAEMKKKRRGGHPSGDRVGGRLSALPALGRLLRVCPGQIPDGRGDRHASHSSELLFGAPAPGYLADGWRARTHLASVDGRADTLGLRLSSAPTRETP
jgi:hypothetical protein